MNTSTPDVPKLWMLSRSTNYEPEELLGLFLACDAAKRHVAERLAGKYDQDYKENVGVWKKLGKDSLESETSDDSRFHLDLVTISDAVPSPMTSFAMAILRGDPVAIDAAQDAIARGA